MVHSASFPPTTLWPQMTYDVNSSDSEHVTPRINRIESVQQYITMTEMSMATEFRYCWFQTHRTTAWHLVPRQSQTATVMVTATTPSPLPRRPTLSGLLAASTPSFSRRRRQAATGSVTASAPSPSPPQRQTASRMTTSIPFRLLRREPMMLTRLPPLSHPVTVKGWPTPSV